MRFLFSGYKHGLVATAACVAFSAFCCICFCLMKHKKSQSFSIALHEIKRLNTIPLQNAQLVNGPFPTGKKLAQVRSVLQLGVSGLHPFFTPSKRTVQYKHVESLFNSRLLVLHRQHEEVTSPASNDIHEWRTATNHIYVLLIMIIYTVYMLHTLYIYIIAAPHVFCSV